MTPDDPKTPDFKVSTHIFQTENGVDWGRLGIVVIISGQHLKNASLQ